MVSNKQELERARQLSEESIAYGNFFMMPSKLMHVDGSILMP